MLKLNLRLAIWASVLNCFWGLVIVQLLSIQGLPKGFMMAVVLSTFLAALFATNGYYLLTKFFSKGRFLYYFLGVAFFVFSNFTAFEAQLSDGSPTPINFPFLVLPMHAIFTFIMVYRMPQLAEKLPV